MFKKWRSACFNNTLGVVKGNFHMNKMGIKTIAFFCLLSFTLAACSAIPILDNRNLVPSGGIFYMDDFSNPKSGWPSWISGNGSLIAYQAGGLRMLVNQAQSDLLAWPAQPGVNFNNARIEVDTVKLGGPDNNHFGILCRFQNTKNYYAFLVTSDGYNGIVKVKDGNFSMLTGATLEYNQAIRQGQSQNHLRADCNNQSLSLWVNSKKSLAANDPDFSAGGVGLTGGSYATSGVDVFFDNFIVYNP